MTSEDAATLLLLSDVVSAIARAIGAGLAEDAVASLLRETADALSSGELERLGEALEP